MIVLLSPAKAMASTFRGHVPPQGPTLPPFLTSHTDALLQRCKQLKSSDIAAAMKISKELADLNHARFQAFVTAGDKKGAAALETAQKTFATTQLVPDAQFKICALAFDGPAFRGFNAAAMSADEFAQASAHVCILSGLYGCLRPTDMIQEYRLEMGTKMKVDDTCDTLYKFWGSAITEHLDAHLAALAAGKGAKVVVNCASQEYYKAVQPARFSADVHVVECVFLDQHRVKSVYAKRARGLMARYVVTHGVARAAATSSLEESLQRLRGFDLENYKYLAKESTDKRLVFNRDSVPASVADEGGDDEDGEAAGAPKKRPAGGKGAAKGAKTGAAATAPAPATEEADPVAKRPRRRGL